MSNRVVVFRNILDETRGVYDNTVHTAGRQFRYCHRRSIGYNPIEHSDLFFSFLSFLLGRSVGTSYQVHGTCTSIFD